MNESEVESLLRHVASGYVAAPTAIALLVINGETEATAMRMVQEARARDPNHRDHAVPVAAPGWAERHV